MTSTHFTRFGALVHSKHPRGSTIYQLFTSGSRNNYAVRTTPQENCTMEVEKDQQQAQPTSSCAPLATFQLYGWKPLPNLSVDDNFLDLLVLVTRNSVCHAAGHMGCIISRPLVTVDNQRKRVHDMDATSTITATGEAPPSSQLLLSELKGGEASFWDSIVSVANNQPLYQPTSSDVHAEVTAISRCAKTGTSTMGCTAYITMPPCKNCLGALVMAGVQRIVSLRASPAYLEEVGQKHNIQVTGIKENTSERRDRVEAYITNYNAEHGIDDRAEVERLRQQRKLEKQERQKKRKLVLLTKPSIHPSQLEPPKSKTPASSDS